MYLIMKSVLLACILIAVTSAQWRPPPPGQGGQGQGQGYPPPQGFGFGPPPGQGQNNGFGPPGGNRPSKAPITAAEFKDGSGFCNSNLPRQKAKAWEVLGDNQSARLIEFAKGVINQNKCLRRGPPSFAMGQCPSTGVGNCDSPTTRTQSVYVTSDDFASGYRYVISNGIPDHCYQVDQADANPNQACEHYTVMRIPIAPIYTGQYREHRMGAVGIAKSGAFLYNHKSAERTCNVAALQEMPSFDPCDGHADPTCAYHYHKAPVCIPGWDQCAFMGYMMDGIPVFGKCSVQLNGQIVNLTSNYVLNANQNGCDASHYSFSSAKANGNLDQANGYRFETDTAVVNAATPFSFPAGSYAYFFTPEFPFIMPGTMAQMGTLCEFEF